MLFRGKEINPPEICLFYRDGSSLLILNPEIELRGIESLSLAQSKKYVEEHFDLLDRQVKRIEQTKSRDSAKQLHLAGYETIPELMNAHPNRRGFRIENENILDYIKNTRTFYSMIKEAMGN